MKKLSSNNATQPLTELVAKLAKGDALAIAQIYKQMYTALVYFGLQVVGKHQQDLVEETIQELFIWLAENYQQVGEIKHFEAYMYQSLRQNLVRQLQAKKAKINSRNRFLQRTRAFEKIKLDSPEKEFLDKEQAHINKIKLSKKLAALPTYQKEVLYLRFYEDRSYKEIAEILSVKAQVARNYVFRALSTLRQQMNKLPVFLF